MQCEERLRMPQGYGNKNLTSYMLLNLASYSLAWTHAHILHYCLHYCCCLVILHAKPVTQAARQWSSMPSILRSTRALAGSTVQALREEQGCQLTCACLAEFQGSVVRCQQDALTVKEESVYRGAVVHGGDAQLSVT